MDRPGVQFGRAATLALLLVCVAHAMAWAGERPSIAGARVYVAHSRIVTDLDCAQLFSEQIIGTVESGLPAVVELMYKLTDDDRKDVRRGVYTFRLRYDVWDDVYALERGGVSETFSSFNALRRAVERMRAVPIVPIDDLEPGGVYAIELSVSVHPLRGAGQKEIVGWVDDNVRGTSDGSWHEQLLNVNGLIHRFFSRGRDDINRSEWFRTILFTPASLPMARNDGGDRL